MYALDIRRLCGLARLRCDGVGRNVWFLGLTSLLTDVSSEMVAAILPMYLVFALRLTPLQVGVVDGIYHGAAALSRLAGGLVADRWHRHREVAAVGYGLSALCKLGLLAAGTAWGALSAVIALDRIGKGVRAAPRDALISLSSRADRLGLAFGIHRALDTAGALAGPIVAFAILALLPGSYDVVLVASFCVALVGLSALLLFVRAVPRQCRGVALSRPSFMRDFAGLLRQPPFRRLVIVASVLPLVTVADGFLYLNLQQRTALDASLFPLLSVVTAASYLVLAVPAGRLADRIGRERSYLLGHVLLLAACAGVLAPAGGWGTGVAALLLLGAYYACTDGALMAAASAVLPEAQRATGLAVIGTATGLARLVASVGFGWAWSLWGIESATRLYVVALGAVLLCMGWWALSVRSCAAVRRG